MPGFLSAIPGAGLLMAGANLLGGLISGNKVSQQAKGNVGFQKQFAQQGIRWKVEDAKAAGLHPLYAIGANTPAFSPVYREDAVGPALSEAGQSLGRAIQAQQTPQEKLVTMLTLEKARKELEESDARIRLIDAEIANMKGARNASQGLPPADSEPIVEGQVSSHPLQGKVIVKPSEVSSGSGVPGLQAGVPDGFRKYAMPGGWQMLLPSQDASESLESAGEIVAPATIVAANVAYYGGQLSDAMRAQLVRAAEAYVAEVRRRARERKPLGVREGNLWRR